MLTISFSPLVPAWALWALAAVAAALVVLAVVSRGPVAAVRALAIALVLAALANPSLVQEEREKVKDIVAVVIDRSTSQTLGDRAAVTDRVRAELERRFGSLADIEPRFIEAGGRQGHDGPQLFPGLSQGPPGGPPG